MDSLLTMSPEGFEVLIAEWLAALGWRTRTTSRGADGGVDVIAHNPDPLTGGLYVVQCKRYGPETVVGAPAVRDFYGTLVHHGAVRGLFVTTSSFSKEARDFAEGKPIALIDGSDLVNMLGEAGLLAEDTEETGYLAHSGQGDLVAWAHEVSESDPAEAERICAELLREDPGMAEAWDLLGHLRYVRGRTEDALEAWHKALELHDTREARYYVLLRIGDALDIGHALDTAEPERVDEAERYFRKAQRECPYHIPPNALSRLCYLYEFPERLSTVDVDRMARAFLLGEFLDKLSPPELQSHAGVIGLPNSTIDRVRAEGARAFEEGKRAFKAKKWDDARRYLTEACECIPNQRAVWLALGQAHARGRSYEDAIDVLNVYLAAWPEAIDAPKVQAFVLKLQNRLDS